MEYPVIYQYFDYRAFLRDLFDFRKRANVNFSHRFFARKAGFKTPNFLSLVMGAKRNLTVSSIANVAKGFGLAKEEREYFENLVLMNQAKTHEEKDRFYKKMIAAKGFAKFQKIGKASYEFFSNWYTPILRELVAMGNRDHTPEQLAVMLDPPITAQMAKKGLDILLKFDLVRQDKNGLWEKCDAVVSTGAETQSILAANYHKEALKCALEALQRYSSGERDISAVVLSVKKSAMPEIKKKIAEFRKELLAFSCIDTEADQVVQVNLQAFPMTRQVERTKKRGE